MDVLTLVATCGLAARAALFVPLGSAPLCASAAPALRGDGHESGRRLAARHRRGGAPLRHSRSMDCRCDARGERRPGDRGRPADPLTGRRDGPDAGDAADLRALRARYGLGADPYAPRDNILAGAAYLREMLDRYGAPWFLAAYNAGPARLDAFLHTGRALPAETQRYLAALAPQIGGTSGALQAAVGTTGLSTKPASEATFPGPNDAIGAGLFATVVVHPEASPTRTVPPIVRPSHGANAGADGGHGRFGCGRT